jgi:hypothetical protein
MTKTIKVKKLRKLLKSLPKNYDIQLGTLDANVIFVTNAKGFWIDEEDKVIVLTDCPQK